MSEKASLLPLPEELYLRSLTGRLVGENLFDGFKKVAVITYPDRICSAMASLALTSFSYYTAIKIELEQCSYMMRILGVKLEK
jgi:hypothetical protein